MCIPTTCFHFIPRTTEDLFKREFDFYYKYIAEYCAQDWLIN